jgi:hypothetical protein
VDVHEDEVEALALRIGELAFALATASAPFLALTTRAPDFSSTVEASSALMSLSSASRIERPPPSRDPTG